MKAEEPDEFLLPEVAEKRQATQMAGDRLGCLRQFNCAVLLHVLTWLWVCRGFCSAERQRQEEVCW